MTLRSGFGAQLGVLCAIIGSPLLTGQSLPRITSPPDRTVVHPGDMLTVRVEAPPELKLESVGLITTLPWDKDVGSKAPPYELNLTIPQRTRPGEYTVTAFGMLRSGEKSGREKEWGRGVPSAPITLVVERADDPVRLEAFPAAMRLHMGKKGLISVTGTFPDGQKVDLHASTKTKYISDSPEVAVSSDGEVNAVAPGAAKITIANGKAKAEVSVVVLKGN